MEDFRKKYVEYSLIDTSKMNQFLLINQAMNFLKIKSENPNLSQGKICKMIGTSDSTIRRIRKELGIPSPYRYKDRIHKEKRRKKNQQNHLSLPQELKNISKDYLASGGVNSGAFNSGAFNSEERAMEGGIGKGQAASGSDSSEDETIKTENQMNRIFKK